MTISINTASGFSWRARQRRRRHFPPWYLMAVLFQHGGQFVHFGRRVINNQNSSHGFPNFKNRRADLCQASGRLFHRNKVGHVRP